MFFDLYLIVDIYSRKIVGWEVHERETAELSAGLPERAIWAEGCVTRPLTLHGLSWQSHEGRDHEGHHGPPWHHRLFQSAACVK
jgi:transposase InsO family protein